MSITLHKGALDRDACRISASAGGLYATPAVLPSRRFAATAAILVGVGVLAALFASRDSDRVTSAAELRENLHGLESQQRVRELLGDPPRIEERPRAEIWDYDHPFDGVTRIRIALGERRRVAWHAMSGRDLSIRSGLVRPRWVIQAAARVRESLFGYPEPTGLSYRRGPKTVAVTLTFGRTVVCACSSPSSAPFPRGRRATIVLDARTHRPISFRISG